jgi:hypothetical protein
MDELFGGIHVPHWDFQDGDLSGWVTLPGFVAGPVPDEGADPKSLDPPSFDFFDQIAVDVELLFPLHLGVHDSPDGGELVVIHDYVITDELLQINLPTEDGPIDV